MAQTAHKHQSETLQLLLVDANTAYLELTRKMLRFHETAYAVDLATSATECLQKVSEKNYDLILLTNDLRGTNGLAVLQALREAGVPQPVVLMLEEGQENLALRALEAGAMDYVVKNRGYLTALPFTIHKVIERVRLVRQHGEALSLQNDARPRPRRGIFLVDRHGRFLSANAEVETITAFSEDELLELTLNDLVPRDREWEFFKWLRLVDEQGSATPFSFMLSAKYGQTRHVKLRLTVQQDARLEITGYRGELQEEEMAGPANEVSRNGRIDQVQLLDDLLAAAAGSYDEPFNVLLSRVVEISRQQFHFQRAALAMLDRPRQMYITQVVAGAQTNALKNTTQPIEVPQEVIGRIFGDRFKIKVVYSSQNVRAVESGMGTVIPERRTQQRRPGSQWHPSDLVLVNLVDTHHRSYGYISLAEPLPGHIPERDAFHNLELFGRLVSQFIQNYYQYVALERRTRRLKQMLVTNNIFKLQLSLGELLREVVWSVKFSLDFDIVALGLISKRSRMLEMRAVAAEDKQQAMQILGLKMDQEDCAALLKKEYLISRSYFVDREEPALRPLKHIYHRTLLAAQKVDEWPPYGMLMVPVKSAHGKIIGFLMLDNPADHARPGVETVRLLELLTNQLTVAMENRVLYVEAKNQAAMRTKMNPARNGHASSKTGVRKLIGKLLG